MIGNLAVHVDGKRVQALGRLPRALLAFLAVHPGPHTRRVVAAKLLPELGTGQLARLRTAINELRNTLGEEHLRGYNSIELVRTSDVVVDLDQFRRYAAGNDPADLARVGAFADCELLALSDDLGEWAEEARRTFHEEMNGTLARAADALDESHPATAEQLTRSWVRRSPFEQRASRALITRLMRQGEPAKAKAEYNRLRSSLATIDLRPSTETNRALDEVLDTAVAPGSTYTPGVIADALLQPPSPLRGRASELAWLEHLWTTACGGTRVIALLRAESGFGKTRLIAEFAARVHGDESRVLYGRADRSGQFAPFAQALDTHLAALPDDALAWLLAGAGRDLSRMIPGLRRRSPEVCVPTDGERGAERYRMFVAVATCLARLARTRPTLLVIDDAHALSRSAVALLRHVLRAVPSVPLLLLVVYRAGTGAELDRALPEIRRDHMLHELELLALANHHAEQILVDLGRHRWTPAELRAAAGVPGLLQRLGEGVSSEIAS